MDMAQKLNPALTPPNKIVPPAKLLANRMPHTAPSRDLPMPSVNGTLFIFPDTLSSSCRYTALF